MTQFEAATLYVGLSVIVMLALKLNSGRVRAGAKVSIGDGGDESLQRAMRMQANAVEDVPVVLLGLFGLAAVSAPVILVHVLGAMFVFARVVHGLGMGGASGFGWGRALGTVLSVLSLLVTGGACVWYALA